MKSILYYSIFFALLSINLMACKNKKETSASSVDNEIETMKPKKEGDFPDTDYKTFVPDEYKMDKVMSEDLLFHLRKTACMGTCPVYAVSVNKDGKGNFEGIRHVKDSGNFVFQLSTSQLEKMVEKIEKLNYSKMNDFYDAPIMDVPSSIITFNHNNQKKQILCRYEAPQNLLNFIKEFENLVFEIEKTPSN